MRTNRTWIAAGLLLVLGQLSLPVQGGAAQFYRLTQDSRVTRITSVGLGPPVVESGRLGGSFRLTETVSPLDWRGYLVGDLSLQWPPFPDGESSLAGSGYYRYGGRTGTQQSLTLTVNGGGVVWTLDSGFVALVEDWPALSITVSATRSLALPGASQQLILELHAVPVLETTHYRLLEGSTLLEDCPVCDRLSRPVPMRGDFDLALVDRGLLGNRYHLFNVLFTAGTADGAGYTLTGEGEYALEGEVAVLQTLKLDTVVSSAGGEDKTTSFTNVVGPPGRPWPMWSVAADETNGSATQVYHVQLCAAPLQELWFSTAKGFHPGVTGTGVTDPVSGGDVLSDRGRVVRRSVDLTRALNLPAGTTNVGLDALDVAPGGTFLFSLDQGLTSATLGAVREGDLVSETGTLFASNADLTRLLGIMPIVPDLGLDAVQVLDGGEILFSTRQDAFSESLGITLGQGDLLSSTGARRQSNADLLARFHPDRADQDYGLDAFHVWPGGEVWFSTAAGFNDQVLGPISDGDLLSDQGYIVFRNVELVSRFLPQEGLTNYGLDALYVVSDATAAVSPPTVLPLAFTGEGDVVVRWKSEGRCFQVESATSPGGPFLPVSPVIAASSWTSTLRAGTGPQFYRVRQW